MFFHTDTADAPWTVIKSDCKKRARLNALRYILHKLPYTNKDVAQIGALDTLLVGRANIVYERGEKAAARRSDPAPCTCPAISRRAAAEVMHALMRKRIPSPSLRPW
jgi:hypothetical protein